MEQLVKYSDIKNLGDISKTFAELPIAVIQEEGRVRFAIADFTSFKATLERCVEEYKGDFIITDANCSVYEKEAAVINKTIKFIKDGANNFVAQFARDLVGVTKGKNRYDGEVQICERILSEAYDSIHNKTVAFREEKKRNETLVATIDADEVIETSPKNTTYTVIVPESQCQEFEEYLKAKGYQAKKGEN